MPSFTGRLSNRSSPKVMTSGGLITAFQDGTISAGARRLRSRDYLLASPCGRSVAAILSEISAKHPERGRGMMHSTETWMFARARAWWVAGGRTTAYRLSW